MLDQALGLLVIFVFSYPVASGAVLVAAAIAAGVCIWTTRKEVEVIGDLTETELEGSMS